MSAAPTRLEADVAIVGAGPVGLTLAMDLAQRGCSVAMLETRRRGEPPNVKCNHVAARTMEQFHRLGVGADVRNAGLPPDYPNDVVFRTAVTGTELSRIHIPGRATRYTDTSGPDGWWPTPEPPHRINQIYLEPILFAHAEARRGVTIRNRAEATAFEQDEHGVTVHARDLDGGAPIEVRARFLIGCDGGRSTVRKAIGATFVGTPVIQKVQSTYLRAPDLLARIPGERRVVLLRVQPAPQRRLLRDRRPRDVPGPQPLPAERDRLRRGRSRRVDPRTSSASAPTSATT